MHGWPCPRSEFSNCIIPRPCLIPRSSTPYEMPFCQSPQPWLVSTIKLQGTASPHSSGLSFSLCCWSLCALIYFRSPLNSLPMPHEPAADTSTVDSSGTQAWPRADDDWPRSWNLLRGPKLRLSIRRRGAGSIFAHAVPTEK